MMNKLSIFALLAFCLSFASADHHDKNIYQIASETPDLSILVELINVADLQDTVSTNNLTVFAPTNSSFEALPEDLLDQLKENGTLAAPVILYHVLGDVVTSGDIENDQVVTTAEGSTLITNIYTVGDSDVVTVNGITVTQADITATNGVVHIINGVLLKPEGNIAEIAIENDAFSTLVSLLSDELKNALSGTDPLTVFAPTDDAFSALTNLDRIAAAGEEFISHIIKFHVTGGARFSAGIFNGLTLNTLIDQELSFGNNEVNGVPLTSEVTAFNGVIHPIGSVLVPEFSIYLLNFYENFTSLNNLIKEAGLEETLNGDDNGPFTLFAPTNEAIGDIESVPADVLLYHVIAEPLLAANITQGYLATVTNETIYFTVTNDAILANCVPVDRANIGTGNPFQSTNGIIHEIGQVLMPPQSLSATVASNDDLSNLLDAVLALGLADTIDSINTATVFAPTNQAWADAGITNVTHFALTDPRAATILQYHISPAIYCSSVLVSGNIPTLIDQSLTITVNGDEVRVNDARVNTANIISQNAVVHTIDAVLIPSGGPTSGTTDATTTGTESDTGAASTMMVNTFLAAILLMTILF